MPHGQSRDRKLHAEARDAGEFRERARAFARRRRGPVEHSMLLEDQKVATKDTEARLDEIMRETNPRLFWD
jgi:hypothetical protein